MMDNEFREKALELAHLVAASDGDGWKAMELAGELLAMAEAPPREKYGLWTEHADGKNWNQSFPESFQVSQLQAGASLVSCIDEPAHWVLRKVFGSFEEGKEYLGDVVSATEWEDLLATWEEPRKPADVRGNVEVADGQ